VTKGISYVTKQCDGGATFSASEEEDESDEADEDGENKSVNSAQTPKLKASAVKKKREVVSCSLYVVTMML